jgi:transglutaminase-like putative cysteine protease
MAIEAALLVLGSLGSLAAGLLTGHDTHFFIGNGLTLLQAAWLLRPLNRREKIFSILMACFQLGVACTFLFDLRFIPVFFCMVWLLPKSFMELECETFKAPPRAGTRAYALILGIAVLFFLAFPRVFMGAALPSSRSGSTEDGTLLDSVVDMTRNGGAESRRVLLQIQGEKLGYLRCYSLTEFDGSRWSTPAPAPKMSIPRHEVDTNSLLHRRVKVKQTHYLGRVLPADGWPKLVRGNFFNNVQRNNQDAVQCGSMWNTGRNMYDYWTDPTGSDATPLNATQRVQLTQCPPQSERLQHWVETLVSGETNSLAAARRLELFLKTNFTYDPGAPVLKRLNAVDEFVFEQKRGHCERFASTLAICLRMRGIPSRVVIGYIPRERGWGSGISVRFSDAHAWTEGYFDGAGWVALDATPAISMPDSSSLLRDWYEAADMAWNIHVVNFDSAAQISLIRFPMAGWKRGTEWAREHHRALLTVGGAGLLLTAMALGWRRWRRSDGKSTRRSQAQSIANHHYRQLLKLLESRGYHREGPQTPMEFMHSLPSATWMNDARLVSDAFCEVRYGGRELAPGREREIHEALQRLRSALG